MLDEQTIRDLAAQLDHAEKTRTQLRHFSAQYPQMTVQDGYAIQREFDFHRADLKYKADGAPYLRLEFKAKF